MSIASVKPLMNTALEVDECELDDDVFLSQEVSRARKCVGVGEESPQLGARGINEVSATRLWAFPAAARHDDD
jgi:hypothetical protein